MAFCFGRTSSAQAGQGCSTAWGLAEAQAWLGANGWMAWWAWADTVSPHNATVVAHTAALRQHRIDVLETLGHPQDPITTQAHACVSEQGLIQHMRPGHKLVGISFQ